jgi:hypothetical protein
MSHGPRPISFAPPASLRCYTAFCPSCTLLATGASPHISVCECSTHPQLLSTKQQQCRWTLHMEALMAPACMNAPMRAHRILLASHKAAGTEALRYAGLLLQSRTDQLNAHAYSCSRGAPLRHRIMRVLRHRIMRVLRHQIMRVLRHRITRGPAAGCCCSVSSPSAWTSSRRPSVAQATRTCASTAPPQHLRAQTRSPPSMRPAPRTSSSFSPHAPEDLDSICSLPIRSSSLTRTTTPRWTCRCTLPRPSPPLPHRSMLDALQSVA